MTPRLLKTVRGRTTALALVAVTVALVVAAVGIVLLQRQVLQTAIDDRLEQRVTDLSTQIEGGDDLTTLLTATVADDTIVQIVDIDGRVVASTTNLEEEEDPISERSAADAVELFDVSSIELSDNHDEAFRVAAKRSEAPGMSVTIYAGAPTESVRESVAALIRGLAVATPILLVLLGAVLWLVTGRALRPVEAIRSHADNIGAGDLDQRVPTTGSGDEVDRLAETMNRMLSRLERASDQQRTFVADASHELRTPITGIITQLESAKLVGQLDSYEIASTISLDEAHRMRRLIEDLLVLARTEAVRPDRRSRLVDLDDIVLEEARSGRRTGIGVRTAAVSAGQVRGDADELRRVVRNLLENAQRHAKERVDVRLREEDGTVTITIADDGSGIPEKDRDRVFDRFIRLDSARARDEGGTGLGLAITRTLIEQYGGTIRIEDSSLGGASFVVKLPSANP